MFVRVTSEKSFRFFAQIEAMLGRPINLVHVQNVSVVGRFWFVAALKISNRLMEKECYKKKLDWSYCNTNAQTRCYLSICENKRNASCTVLLNTLRIAAGLSFRHF